MALCGVLIVCAGGCGRGGSRIALERFERVRITSAALEAAVIQSTRRREKRMRKGLMVVAIAAAVALGCLNSGLVSAQEMKGDKMAKPKTLYSRLGGKKAITAVVDEFVNNCAGDNRINKFFADTAKDPARL